MNYGCMDTIQNLRINLLYGRRHILQDKKMQNREEGKSKPCSQFYLTYQDYEIPVLRRLTDAIRRKWPQLHQDGEWWLQHDNAPAHMSQDVYKRQGHLQPQERPACPPHTIK